MGCCVAMYQVFVLVLIGNLLSSGVSAAQGIGRRVVNGKSSNPGDHPHQATIQRRLGSYWTHFCGGSLIASNKVLTAAHCVDDVNINSLRVGLGWNRLHTANGFEQTFGVAEAIIHSNYTKDADGFPNDIAVITLNGTANVTKFVDVAQMGAPGKGVPDEECVITGWSFMDGAMPYDDFLKQATMTVISNSLCAELWAGAAKARIYDSHICLLDKPKTSCNGDSGGPLMCGGFLTGVASWGNKLCSGRLPSVYLRTSAYREWIFNPN